MSRLRTFLRFVGAVLALGWAAYVATLRATDSPHAESVAQGLALVATALVAVGLLAIDNRQKTTERITESDVNALAAITALTDQIETQNNQLEVLNKKVDALAARRLTDATTVGMVPATVYRATATPIMPVPVQRVEPEGGAVQIIRRTPVPIDPEVRALGESLSARLGVPFPHNLRGW